MAKTTGTTHGTTTVSIPGSPLRKGAGAQVTKAAPKFPAPGPPVKPGIARLESDNGLKVEALMGPDGVTPTDGWGGWEEIARPRKKPIVDWTAGKPLRMTLQLQFEQFMFGVSVEPDIAALEQMARRGSGDQRPPKIRCTLPASLPRSPSVPWVIEDLTWENGDDSRAYRADGKRTRQRVTVALCEAIADDLIKANPAKNHRKAKKGGSSTYTVKKGDTLPRIAAKFSLPLSDIKKANPKVRDKIKVGQKLKIPDEGSKAIVT